MEVTDEACRITTPVVYRNLADFTLTGIKVTQESSITFIDCSNITISHCTFIADTEQQPDNFLIFKHCDNVRFHHNKVGFIDTNQFISLPAQKVAIKYVRCTSIFLHQNEYYNRGIIESSMEDDYIDRYHRNNLVACVVFNQCSCICSSNETYGNNHNFDWIGAGLEPEDKLLALMLKCHNITFMCNRLYVKCREGVYVIDCDNGTFSKCLIHNALGGQVVNQINGQNVPVPMAN